MNAEYVPERGRLVPILIVFPLIPWVRVEGSHCDASITEVVAGVDPDPPLGAVVFVLEPPLSLRPLPHAAARSTERGAERHDPDAVGAFASGTRVVTSSCMAVLSSGAEIGSYTSGKRGHVGTGARRPPAQPARDAYAQAAAAADDRRRAARTSSRISPMPKIAGESRFLTESLMCQNRILLGNDSLIHRSAEDEHEPADIGPSTVAVPPITTATRNSIESWKVDTDEAFASRFTSTKHDPATPA